MVCLRVTFDVIFLPFFLSEPFLAFFLALFLPIFLSCGCFLLFFCVICLTNPRRSSAGVGPSIWPMPRTRKPRPTQSIGAPLHVSLSSKKKTNKKTKNKKKAKEKNTREKQPKKGQDGGAVGFFLFSFSFSSSFSFPSTSDWPSRADDSVTKARSVSNRRRRNWPTNHEGALARAAPFLCHSSLAR